MDLVRDLHRRGITVVSITNDRLSPMARESDCVIDLQSSFDNNVSVTMYSGVALAGCLVTALSCGEQIDRIYETLDCTLVYAQRSISDWGVNLTRVIGSVSISHIISSPVEPV